MTEDKHPKTPGIGAILTSPDGRVVAHAFDFERSTMGGCKLWEGQRYRARHACMRDFIREYTYGDVAKVIEAFDAANIVEKLCREHKYRMTYVAIGHDVEDRELNR